MQKRNVGSRIRVLADRLSTPIATLKQFSAPIDDLTRLANRLGSDKGDQHYDRHNYTRVYSALFAPLREQPLRLLEIGLLHILAKEWADRSKRSMGTTSATRAPSLEMWSAYFPNATIFGFDINDFSSVQIERCKIVRGDMGSREDLTKLVNERNGPFDIIIDDASHASHHQQIALGFLFPYLNPGGLYIIEDLTYQPSDLERNDIPKTLEILRRAALTSSFHTPVMTDEERLYLQREVDEIALFDSLCPNRTLGSRDALAVIRKISPARPG